MEAEVNLMSRRFTQIHKDQNYPLTTNVANLFDFLNCVYLRKSAAHLSASYVATNAGSRRANSS